MQQKNCVNQTFAQKMPKFVKRFTKLVVIQSQRLSIDFDFNSFMTVFRSGNGVRPPVIGSRLATVAVNISPSWKIVKNVIAITAHKR